VPGLKRSTNPSRDVTIVVEGFITAFWWAGGIFAPGALAHGAPEPAVAQ
jgi:hypothetical protein